MGNDPAWPKQPTSQPVKVTSAGLSSKEVEVINADVKSEAGLRAVGQEWELPKEVAQAGVKVQPTSVQIPSGLAQMGVKPLKQTPTINNSGTVIALPLTDDQIMQGLQQNVTNSWRWLAQWCLRKLKQLHLIIKTMHGKIVRINI